jgi:hypothetical protein
MLVLRNKNAYYFVSRQSIEAFFEQVTGKEREGGKTDQKVFAFIKQKKTTDII